MHPTGRPATAEEAEELAKQQVQIWVTEEVYNWVSLRRELAAGTLPLWLCVVSTDEAERIARRELASIEGPPAAEDWPDVGARLRKLATAIATRAGRMPIQWRGKLGTVPPEVECLQQTEEGGVTWATARATQRIEAGQWARVEAAGVDTEQTFARGWNVESLTASAEGLLAIDAATVDAGEGLHPADKARQRWAAFEAGGPLQPTAGHEGLALFGLTDTDAERLRALWAPYRVTAEPNGTAVGAESARQLSPAVAGLVKLAWKLLQRERKRAAEALEEAKHRGVAVVRPVAAGMLAMSPQQTLPYTDEPARVATIQKRVFGRIDADVAKHAPLLASVPGLRLITWLAKEGHRNMTSGSVDPRLVQFDGGVAFMRELFGGAKDTPWLDIIRAGAGFRFEHDGREFGTLWGYELPIDPADRRRRLIQIVIGTPLLPGMVQSMTDREARRLVPVLDFEPPVGGLDASKHAAVWRAANGVLVHMVDRAAAGEVEEHGGVLLDDQRFRRIASNAGLQWNDVDRTLGAWLDGDSDKAPPLIVREGNVVRLAEPHAPQWEFIVEGGRRRAIGRASGKAAAKSRRSDEVEARRSKRGRK